MGSALYEKLDQTSTLIREILDSRDMPLDVILPLEHAFDDVQQARGRPRRKNPEHQKPYLGKFAPGDPVGFLLNSYPGSGGTVPDVLSARVIEPPKRRSPNDYEDMGNKKWFFTSDLPASVTGMLDATMHLETPHDVREVFHLNFDHWSRWREKNAEYWSIITVIPEI